MTTATTKRPETATGEIVSQIVRLECGHECCYRIPQPLADSGFARVGVAWRCATCDPSGETKRRIADVNKCR
ncbi:hypothetical protein SAMN05421630_110184 [Prauserella marina]|uniref:Uncharacterized protein n=1 Tax=Prauserella marina TaxID=530584 RepID=A0A1G6W554_9PSEU|nr:hypothetical protein DES30_108183 [Prauserella marina]SDD60823.1 hypothetical protein SAMN05421630_110184 [Prauserella marina]